MDTHYSPLHSNNFTNHLPMFEQSLIRLDLPQDLIEQRLKDYIKNTPLRDLNKPETKITQVEKEYLHEYKSYVEIIDDHNKAQVIHDLLNTLEDDLDAHLYHGLIRLAFAVGNNDHDELAKALAFFKVVGKKTSTKALQSLTPKTSKDLKADWNQLMDLRRSLKLDFRHLSMDEKLELVLNNQELSSHLTQLSTKDENEKRIAFILCLWYLKTRDFYVLHVVNAYNALTSLKSYIDDYDGWLNSFWLKAQLYSLFTDERLPVIKNEVKTWDVILEEIKVTTDVHDIKLVYACKELSDRFQLKIFNKIAHIVSHKYWLHQ